jgi:hypothetical protein
MVANALAEGEGYIPGEGDYFALVAIPTDNELLQKMVLETVVPDGAEPEPTPDTTPETNPQQSPKPSSEPESTSEPTPETTPQPSLEPEPTDDDKDSISSSGEFPIGWAVTIAIVLSSIGIGLTVYFRARKRE